MRRAFATTGRGTAVDPTTGVRDARDEDRDVTETRTRTRTRTRGDDGGMID